METETGSDQCRDDLLARFYALTDARRRREREAVEASYRRRIVEAAGTDPNKLSEQGQRILRRLAEWDDWTVGGVVELVAAARMAAFVTGHRADLADKTRKLRESEAATDATMARYDQRWGVER
jgi:hypothetical protein